jgi:putative peptidoglycan binding protein
MAIVKYDDNFKNRLLAFQRAHGLTEDGRLGAAAWAKLVEVPAAPVAGDVPAEVVAPVSVGSEPRPSGTPGRRAPAVTREEFPALYSFAELDGDENALNELLRTQLGFDLHAVLQHIDTVVRS